MSVRVFISSIDQAFGAASRICVPADRAHAGALKSPRRRREFLAGRALARFAIDQCAGIPPVRQNLRVSQTGRPVCVCGPDFNLSHSGGWVVCAVAPSGNTGVDLQFPSAHISTKEISRLYFCPAERSWLRSNGDSGFYVLWTLKEAHLKANGLSAMSALGSIECAVDRQKIRSVVHGGEPTQLSIYSFGNAYLALATTERFGQHARMHIPEWHGAAGAALPDVVFMAGS